MRPDHAPVGHPQKDLIHDVYRVVFCRYAVARCDECVALVQQAGDGELLGSRIGPHLSSKVILLLNMIGNSFRKVPQAIEELFSSPSGQPH